MPLETILQLLKNSGFVGPGGGDIVASGGYILLEDPACFVRSVMRFLDVAWIALAVLTAFLLMGWAVSLIRGADTKIMDNMRNLTLMFGILAAVGPIVNTIWGGELFATACRRIEVPIDEIQKILDSRKLTLKTWDQDNLYEEFDIYDSAAKTETDALAALDAALPQQGSGRPERPGGIVVSGGAVRGGPGAVRVVFERSPSGRGQVSYIRADGSGFMKIGGSRSSRNNNPGNIKYSDKAVSFGAIGRDDGNFAIFPDEATGMAASIANLKSPNYQKLTLAAAVARWAPPSENDTAAYQNIMARRTGIPLNTPMSSLTDAQLARVASVIREHEGWEPSREVSL